MTGPDEPKDRTAREGEASPPRHSPAFQTQAEADQFRAQLGKELLANLARNVMAEAKELEPGADWSTWTLGERTFRVSLDRKEARELGADGYWLYVIAEYVVAHAKPDAPAAGRPVSQFKQVSTAEMDRALAASTPEEMQQAMDAADDRYGKLPHPVMFPEKDRFHMAPSHLPPAPPGFVVRVTTATYVVFRRDLPRHSDFTEELLYVFESGQWTAQVPNWDDLVRGGDGDFYHGSGYGDLAMAVSWLEQTYAKFLADPARAPA